MRQHTSSRLLALALTGTLAACSGKGSGGTDALPPVTAADHEKWFPIAAGAPHALDVDTGEGPMACESCHRSAAVEQVTCVGCHVHPSAPVEGHDVNASLHLEAPDYAAKVPAGADALTQSAGCLGCHPAGRRLLAKFPHGGIPTSGDTWCGVCHDEGAAFAALPLAGFVHQAVGDTDCGACHVITTWKGASNTPITASDPQANVAVDALLPAWSGPTIVSVAADPQSLKMTMNHATTALPAALLADCATCHAQASGGAYYPGVLHYSLRAIDAGQPTRCGDCHGGAKPEGFVGDLDPARQPSTGPMRHDAVRWSGGAPTTSALLTQDCSVCHFTPDDLLVTEFGQNPDGGGIEFHASLTEAGVAQPDSCLDCHANSRPQGDVTTASFTFDHSNVIGDCKDCHASFTDWAGARFHTTASSSPTTCLPCHEAERPATTTGWTGAYTQSPFDYGTNAAGVTHGDGLDCAACHTGPGTGLWGVNPNWVGGHFDHAATSVASTTCITCHSTQRPDRLTPPADAGFDHATNGASDCVGCHQATMTRGTFVALKPIPGGDWRGGTTYPGATIVTSATQFVKLQSTALTRASGKVTGMTTSTVTLPNAFLHTSAAIPSPVAPGPVGSTNQNSCWHCHTSTGTTVTAYSDGKFHASLSNYRATPTGAVSPLPQPTACLDCHKSMRPPNIVSRLDGGTWVRPMDHQAAFTGGAVAGVAALDCGSCHHTPGLGATQWSDGTFHANQPAGTTPADCVTCHYPLMTTATADVTSPAPAAFAMKHRSTLVTTQACGTCHTGALTKAANTPTATGLWKPGAYHSTLGTAPQPAACLDCHAGSMPATATASAVTYTLGQGATASNGKQWMNHQDPTVTGKDCVTCHAADAKAQGSAWSTSTAYHAKVAAPTGCTKCHGTGNGLGTTIGTNNNLPAALVDSDTVTTSSASPGVADQLSHADANVTGSDCKRCHTQVGPSTAAGVQGAEWSKAAFHKNFTTASPLLSNGTTARCSNCHLNVKPGASYAAFNHAAYTGTSTQDCAACHAYPGTSATTPNWKGASGAAHATTGSTLSSTLDCNTCHGQNGSANKHLATTAASHYGGITNGNRCTSCHIDFTAFSGTTAVLKYGHTNGAANAGSCTGCHSFKSSVYTTLTTTPTLNHPLNGNTHQFSQTLTVLGSYRSRSFNQPHTNSRMGSCGACHPYSSTTATTDVWRFVHRPANAGISNSTSSNGCNLCH